MNILFVGDSYSTNYSEFSWTSIVEKKYQSNAVNLSKPASSLNYSYKILDNELKNSKYDVIIFTITSADRIYHSKFLIHDRFPQNNDSSPVSEEIKKSIDLYYKNLHDRENRDIQWNIFCRGILHLTMEHPKTKFIFVNAFEIFNYYGRGNCVITEDPLIQFSLLDRVGHHAETLGKIPKDRYNHLTIFQNQTLASYIIKFIDGYIFGKISRKKLKDMDKLR
jgi:hypothetical protein